MGHLRNLEMNIPLNYPKESKKQLLFIQIMV